MFNRRWWKLTFDIYKDLEETTIWKLHDLEIFTFASSCKKEEKDKLLMEIWLFKDHWNDTARISLVEKLSEFFKVNSLFNVIFSWDLIQEEDWTESWKKFWGPTQIGENLLILPSWMELPNEFINKKIIKIDPGAAFGTGGHPSTSLCLEEIERNSLVQKRILDIGSGSGILTIASRLFGAKPLYALDIDCLACSSTEDNYKLNFGNLNDLTIRQGNFSELVKDKFFPEFDFVVCNILAEVIIQIIPSIFAVLSNKGQVILSGIIESKKYEIIKVLDSNKFNVENLTSKNDWICIKASKGIKKL